MIMAGNREAQTHPVDPLNAAPRNARIAGAVVFFVIQEDGDARCAVSEGVGLKGCEIGEGLSVGGGRGEGHASNDGDESEEVCKLETHDGDWGAWDCWVIRGDEGWVFLKGKLVKSVGE